MIGYGSNQFNILEANQGRSQGGAGTAGLQNCYTWPYIQTYPQYHYTYITPSTSTEPLIRKVETGFILEMSGKEYAFESLDNLFTKIREHYEEKK